MDMKIPSSHNRLMPYIIIPNGYKLIEFMKNVFGATEQAIIPRSEGEIMHGELRIGEAVIMFADKTEQIAARPAGIFIYVANTDDTFKKAIEAGCQSLMEPVQQPYGYTCGFHDPFGNDWWPVQFEK
jgi:uncharacterized glyoxalase superfamily protein PhnB